MNLSSKYYYKIHLQYDGSDYIGFQWQKEKPTIQSEINLALSKICHGQFSTLGASRTDAGVHALYQIVKITSETAVKQEDFIRHLPQSIICTHFEQADFRFNPTLIAKSKEYRYFFSQIKNTNLENQKYIPNCSFQLDFDLMKKCVELIKGEHNFQNFVSTGSNVKSTIRTISESRIDIVNPHDIFSQYPLFKIPPSISSCFQVTLIGDGFLKQMVRHLVSGLWMVGSQKMTLEEFKNNLDGQKQTKQLWKVAPANGLFLFKINE
jgi:tRNA pseudouridine38-40 synthase